MKKLIIYLFRAGVGFYFAYPALLKLLNDTPKLTGTPFACFGPAVPSDTVWTLWWVFFIFLGLMIAFWKTPFSWILLGVLILVGKLYIGPVTFQLLMQVVPVFLVALGLGIHYGRQEFGHGDYH
jgi:hypothetical protein